MLTALARLGYVYPPDTVDLDEHEASVATNAREVIRAMPALVEALGGTREVAAAIEVVLADHPAVAVAPAA